MLLRRLCRLPVDDRASVAHGLRRIIATSERRPIPVGVRSILHPSVAAACVPAFRRIDAALRDATRPVPDVLHAALRSFLTDGATSPLYRRDPLVACLAAEALADRFAPSTRHPRREAA
jgi:hypothetical protein